MSAPPLDRIDFESASDPGQRLRSLRLDDIELVSQKHGWTGTHWLSVQVRGEGGVFFKGGGSKGSLAQRAGEG